MSVDGHRTGDPIWADDAHEREVEEVWTTAGPPSTTCVTVDAGENQEHYARVSCAGPSGRTTVTVDYDPSALSDAGADRRQQLARNYDDMLGHWEHHTSRALAATASPKDTAGRPSAE